MPQLFSPYANTVARVSLVLVVALALSVLWGLVFYVRSSYATGTDVIVNQPVPFSHQHHAAGLGIDCRYCHDSVDSAAHAGMPPTETCMTCHSQIWTNAALLAPVRSSFTSGEAIPWQRVTQVADFVYFNHAIHVQKGIGCTSCHGQVDQMPLMTQAKPMQMTFCLACHREPERFVRPKEAVFAMDWTPPPDQTTRGQQLVAAYHIDKSRLTNCSVCHR